MAPGTGAWGPGLGIWLLSALWGAAVLRGYLGPQAAGWFAAGFGLLTGAELTMDGLAGCLLAAATVAGLLTAGVLLHRVPLVAIGALGALQVVPPIVVRYLPSVAAVAVALLAVALLLLGFVLWLARRWRPQLRRASSLPATMAERGITDNARWRYGGGCGG